MVPGQFYLLTRRCTQRQFLLRPDAVTNNNFLYVLTEAAARFGMNVLGSCIEADHELCAAAHKWCYGERPVM